MCLRFDRGLRFVSHLHDRRWLVMQLQTAPAQQHQSPVSVTAAAAHTPPITTLATNALTVTQHIRITCEVQPPARDLSSSAQTPRPSQAAASHWHLFEHSNRNK